MCAGRNQTEERVRARLFAGMVRRSALGVVSIESRTSKCPRRAEKSYLRGETGLRNGSLPTFCRNHSTFEPYNCTKAVSRVSKHLGPETLRYDFRTVTRAM